MHQSTCHTTASPVIGNKTVDRKTSGFLATALNRAGNFWRRGKLTSLEKLEDHMLDDIGIDRFDLQWARRLPLDRNPLIALDNLARQRSRARNLVAGRRLPGSRPI